MCRRALLVAAPTFDIALEGSGTPIRQLFASSVTGFCLLGQREYVMAANR